MIFGLRAAAIRWSLTLPGWLYVRQSGRPQMGLLKVSPQTMLDLIAKIGAPRPEWLGQV